MIRAVVIAVVLALGYMLASAVPANAQVGSCTPALAETYLDVNNVRARIHNNGGLFYRGEPHVYEVPAGGGISALFASGIWVGGLVDGQLRVAGTHYGPWEFWAGPLDDNGYPPADCSIYDKIWKISRSDVQDFEDGNQPTIDLASWPTGLGAPTLAPAAHDDEDNDGDGEVDEAGEMREIHKEILLLPLSERVDRVIDLDAGERPQLLGDQMLWWIMNDRGNSHERSETPPIGLEVHASAFAFNQPGHIGNTTFYKLDLFMKADTVKEAYVSIFSDPDLGDFQDDYVGSDTSLGLGFVYNADNFDGSSQGYGDAPPAVGYDFFQGAIVRSLGDTASVGGAAVPDYRNLKMTSFVRDSGTFGPTGTPNNGTEKYRRMKGLWKDGSAIRVFSDGYYGAGHADVTTFMFPGDPVTRQFWSEINAFPDGSPLEPADRRFTMSSGPFTLSPDEPQEIVYGIVWARGTDHLDSVTQLRRASETAQTLFDLNFQPAQRPDAPYVKFTALDRQVAMEWTNPPTSNNYLDGYREFNPFGDPSNPDYVLEGYEVYEFTNEADLDGKLVAAYDIANGVTEVLEYIDDDAFPTQTASGRDSGLQHSHTVSGLTNYQTYYFGVRAYAYNPLANPQVYHGPFTRAAVAPAQSSGVLSESATETDTVADPGADNVGQGSVSVDIVNAALVRDCTYRVEFYALPGGETTYDVYCDAEKVFDGSLAGAAAPQRQNVFVLDGLEFSVVGPERGFKDFLVVANAAGPLNPPDMGAYAFNNSGFPHASLPDQTEPAAGYQQSTSNAVWGFHAGGGDERPYGPASSAGSFLGRAARGDNFDRIGVYDYEMRFTASGSQTFRFFEDGAVMTVPFEIWRTGIGTPDNASDDVRLIPVICETGCHGDTTTTDLLYDIGGDHNISGGADDPRTDWIYWYEPQDLSPGSVGYEAFWADPSADLSAKLGGEILARTVLVAWNAGTAPPYPAALPEEGTVFRIETTKPSQPGDVFTFSTETFAAKAPSLDEQKERLKDIGIVPNPYKGASSYEVSRFADEVRFTNLPDVATIRVFTLNGTLLRTIVKNSPGNRTLSWDLTTDSRLRLASGMYLIHVEVPGVGEHVIKFGVAMKQIQFGVN